MQFADNRALREHLWRAFSNRAFEDDYDNRENITKILTLKAERAKLLGFNTHADFVLEERMAQSADAVFAFLEKLRATYKPGAEKDLADIQTFSGMGDDLKHWDISYYAEKLKQEKFFSSEDFRPYPAATHCAQGML